MSGPSPTTQRRTSAREPVEGGEEDVEALAGLVAADEEHGRPAVGGRVVEPGLGLGPQVDLDGVEQQRVLAAEVALGEVGGGLRDGAAVVEAAGQPRQRPAEVLVRRAVAGGVEGAEQRRVLEEAGPSGSGPGTAARGGGRRRRPRRAAPASCAAGPTGRGRGGPPSRWPRSGPTRPSGVTPASGGGPSQGPSTRASWPSVRRARAEAEHLGLHAAGDGEAVGRHQPDPHHGSTFGRVGPGGAARCCRPANRRRARRRRRGRPGSRAGAGRRGPG